MKAMTWCWTLCDTFVKKTKWVENTLLPKAILAVRNKGMVGASKKKGPPTIPTMEDKKLCDPWIYRPPYWLHAYGYKMEGSCHVRLNAKKKTQVNMKAPKKKQKLK
jgi:hypothetical protein